MPAHMQLDMQADPDPRAPSMLACPDCPHKQGQGVKPVSQRVQAGGPRR